MCLSEKRDYSEIFTGVPWPPPRRRAVFLCDWCWEPVTLVRDCPECVERGHLVCLRYHRVAAEHVPAAPEGLTAAQARERLQSRRLSNQLQGRTPLS